MVRAVGRRHETSVRFALGAGRMRVVRQFLAESMLIAAAGCAVGIALGEALMRGLVAVAPPNIPRLETVGLDWQVFAVAAAICDHHRSRVRPGSGMAGVADAPGGESEDHRAQDRHAQRRPGGAATLTVAEVALSMVLITGAGLFLKSFARIMGMDLGFRTANVLAMNIALPDPALRRRRTSASSSSRNWNGGCARCPACNPRPSPTAFRCAADGVRGSRSMGSAIPTSRPIRRR